MQWMNFYVVHNLVTRVMIEQVRSKNPYVKVNCNYMAQFGLTKLKLTDTKTKLYSVAGCSYLTE